MIKFHVKIDRTVFDFLTKKKLYGAYFVNKKTIFKYHFISIDNNYNFYSSYNCSLFENVNSLKKVITEFTKSKKYQKSYGQIKIFRLNSFNDNFLIEIKDRKKATLRHRYDGKYIELSIKYDENVERTNKLRNLEMHL